MHRIEQFIFLELGRKFLELHRFDAIDLGKFSPTSMLERFLTQGFKGLRTEFILAVIEEGNIQGNNDGRKPLDGFASRTEAVQAFIEAR